MKKAATWIAVLAGVIAAIAMLAMGSGSITWMRTSSASQPTLSFPVWHFCTLQLLFSVSALPTVRTATDTFRQMQSTVLTAGKKSIGR